MTNPEVLAELRVISENLRRNIEPRLIIGLVERLISQLEGPPTQFASLLHCNQDVKDCLVNIDMRIRNLERHS